MRVWFYLDEEWNGVKPSDDDSVVDISCQDVQSSCATFHYFLHTHTLLYVYVGKKGNQIQKNFQVFKERKHVILLVWLHTTNCCWLPPMLVRLWVSW